MAVLYYVVDFDASLEAIRDHEEVVLFVFSKAPISRIKITYFRIDGALGIVPFRVCNNCLNTRTWPKVCRSKVKACNSSMSLKMFADLALFYLRRQPSNTNSTISPRIYHWVVVVSYVLEEQFPRREFFCLTDIVSAALVKLLLDVSKSFRSESKHVQ